jgi:hypothetical protein
MIFSRRISGADPAKLDPGPLAQARPRRHPASITIAGGRAQGRFFLHADLGVRAGERAAPPQSRRLFAPYVFASLVLS